MIDLTDLYQQKLSQPTITTMESLTQTAETRITDRSNGIYRADGDL